MKTPKRKRAAVVAATSEITVDSSAVEQAMDARAPEEVLEASLAAVLDAEPDLDQTSTMPAPLLVVAAPEAVPGVTSIITLSSNSTVKDAASLKAQLVKVAALPATVSLDVSSVERIDTATLQLLCAFVRERAERKLAVEWLGSPKAFVDSSRLLGVHTLLGLPEAGVA